MSHRLTIKGQVTIPKDVREHLGLRAGDSEVEFFIDQDGSVRICKAEKTRVKVANRQTTVRERVPFDGCAHVLALLSGSYHSGLLTSAS